MSDELEPKILPPKKKRRKRKKPKPPVSDTIAVVVIATTARRDTTFPKVIDSVLAQSPNEIVVVADYDWPTLPPWRHLVVNAVTKSTIDALMKREAGWAATRTDTVLFLSDDHRLAPDFIQVYRQKYGPDASWDFMAPARYAIKDGQMVGLNMGINQKYVGGHAGLYRRVCASLLPWMATLHDRNWDMIQSHHLLVEGARLRYAEQDLAIEDIEPGGKPWE